MARIGARSGAVRVLVALIAVLLPAGAFAAASIDGGQPRRVDTRVGAAGFAGEQLAADPPRMTPTVAVTSSRRRKSSIGLSPISGVT